METPGSGNIHKYVKCLLYVVCILLSLHAFCSCDSSEVSEDVIDPSIDGSNYFFSLPMFNFGIYFYMAFQNDSLNTLYETFCDIRISNYTLTYGWFGELNSDRFPYYYIITATKLQRMPDSLAAVQQVYSNNIVCDTLSDVREGEVMCRRMRLDDDLCDRVPCLKYLISVNSTRCPFPCGMLMWELDYDLQIHYLNFGDIPPPVKDGVCAIPDEAQNTNGTNTTTAVTASTQHYVSPSTTDVTIDEHEQSTTSYINSTEVMENANLRPGEFQSSSMSIPILVGSVGGGIILLAMSAAIVCYRCSKGRSPNRSQYSSGNGSASSATETDISKVPSELSRSEADCSSGDNSDSGYYHTLDEMCESFRHVSNLDECDDQGYNIIQDGETKLHFLRFTEDEKKCRPLPSPPNNIQQQRMHPQFLDGKSTGESSTDASTHSLPCSLDSGELGLPPPSYLFSYRKLPNSTEYTVFPPRPRPHKRHVDLEEHTLLGLVNLRPDDTVFGHMTEVKLVRTQQGHLELVDPKGEKPVFSDYYTRLHLITETGGSVGVVGLLDTNITSNIDTSMDTAGELSCDRKDYPTHVPDPRTTRDKSINSEEISFPDNGLLDPYIIYFGPVSLIEDVNVSPCDYLTVLDINPNRIATGSDGYLTVVDIEKINGSTGSHAYLQLY